ncbi:hypothetical protein ELI_4045 [Eubacterium callanderi]|uniref:Uncharacterized protein n=1 Tax=Eubacterium callanderi TaxID=53442 RepID=E3GH34_9FIRM|nr:hypothetical protein ELI_4045 [Eubacterium callanderi]
MTNFFRIAVTGKRQYDLRTIIRRECFLIFLSGEVLVFLNDIYKGEIN